MSEVRTTTRQSRHDLGTRIQALTLLESGMKPSEIKEITGIGISQIYAIRKTAKKHGYDPAKSKKLLIEYVVDMPRSGRPRKVTEEKPTEDVVTDTSPARI